MKNNMLHLEYGINVSENSKVTGILKDYVTAMKNKLSLKSSDLNNNLILVTKFANSTDLAGNM